MNKVNVKYDLVWKLHTPYLVTWWCCNVLMFLKFWSRIYIFLRRLVNMECSVEITTRGFDIQPTLLCVVMIYFVFFGASVSVWMLLVSIIHCGYTEQLKTDTSRIQFQFSTVITIRILFRYIYLMYSHLTWARRNDILKNVAEAFWFFTSCHSLIWPCSHASVTAVMPNTLGSEIKGLLWLQWFVHILCARLNIQYLIQQTALYSLDEKVG